MDPNERLQYPLPEEELLREIQKVRRSFFIALLYKVSIYTSGQSKSLFQPTRLSVHVSVRTCVRQKFFFLLKSPWNHPLTPGVDPRG